MEFGALNVFPENVSSRGGGATFIILDIAWALNPKKEPGLLGEFSEPKVATAFTKSLVHFLLSHSQSLRFI